MLLNSIIMPHKIIIMPHNIIFMPLNIMNIILAPLNNLIMLHTVERNDHNVKRKDYCAADFSLLNLPKGKSLGRSKPATNS